MGILAGQAEEGDAPALAEQLLPWLEDYHNNRRARFFWPGRSWTLSTAWPTGALACRGDLWQEQSLPGRDNQPLIAYLDLF